MFMQFPQIGSFLCFAIKHQIFSSINNHLTSLNIKKNMKHTFFSKKKITRTHHISPNITESPFEVIKENHQRCWDFPQAKSYGSLSRTWSLRLKIWNSSRRKSPRLRSRHLRLETCAVVGVGGGFKKGGSPPRK